MRSCALVIGVCIGLAQLVAAQPGVVFYSGFIAGSANGAAGFGPDTAPGGRGGDVIVELGVNVDVGRGELPTLDHDVTLTAGEYHFRQIVPGSGVVAPIISVQGTVRIYCQCVCIAKFRGDFSAGRPNVKVYAGQPTWVNPPAGLFAVPLPPGFPTPPDYDVAGFEEAVTVTHRVEFDMNAPANNAQSRDAGSFEFYSTASPFTTIAVNANGGRGWNGGAGGNGGSAQFRVLGTISTISASANAGNGGNGNDSAVPQGQIAQRSGGRGGNGGTITFYTDRASSNNFFQANGGAGGIGSNGVDIAADNSVAAARDGGAGGNGGQISVRSESLPIVNVGASGGQGGAGGFGASRAPIPAGQPATSGLAGGDGGNGGKGGDAGTLRVQVTNNGNPLTQFIYLNGGYGGNAAAGGRGGNAAATNSGTGATGGIGGRGGVGGNGGAAGRLLGFTLQESPRAGNGGVGGNGGYGGTGGSNTGSGPGGRGGDAGQAGRGGNGSTPGNGGAGGLGGAGGTGNPAGQTGQGSNIGQQGSASSSTTSVALANPLQPRDADHDTWTIMYFGAGDDYVDFEFDTGAPLLFRRKSIEDDICRQLDSIENLNFAGTRVNALAFLDRHPDSPLGTFGGDNKIPDESEWTGRDWGDWTCARRGWVVYDPSTSVQHFRTALPRVTQTGRSEANTGDPDTLVSFARWAREAAPADHYLLVLSGHGYGPHGLMHDNTDRDVTCNGRERADRLEMFELRQALRDITADGPIDVLVLDACLTSTVEVLAEVARADVDYCVAAQSLTRSGLFNGPANWLRMLRDTPTITPADLALAITNDPPDSVRALIAPAAMPPVVDACAAFTDEALALLRTSPDRIAIRRALVGAARDAAHLGTGYPDLRDLVSFMNEAKRMLAGRADCSALLSAADDVIAAISQAVLRVHTPGVSDASGLSVKLDLAGGSHWQAGCYTPDRVGFLDATAWDSLLCALSSPLCFDEGTLPSSGALVLNYPIVINLRGAAVLQTILLPIDAQMASYIHYDVTGVGGGAGLILTDSSGQHLIAASSQQAGTLSLPGKDQYLLQIIAAGVPIGPGAGVSLALLWSDESTPKPQFSVSQDIDLGSIRGDTDALASITLTNTGISPLSLRGVAADDGGDLSIVFGTLLDQAIVGPGQTLRVPIQVAAGVGPVIATIGVVSDDPQQPEHEIVVRANRVTADAPALEVAPDTLYYGKYWNEHLIDVQNRTSESVGLEVVDQPVWMHLDPTSVTLAANGNASLLATVNRVALSAGDVTDVIRLRDSQGVEYLVRISLLSPATTAAGAAELPAASNHEDTGLGASTPASPIDTASSAASPAADEAALDDPVVPIVVPAPGAACGFASLAMLMVGVIGLRAGWMGGGTDRCRSENVP